MIRTKTSVVLTADLLVSVLFFLLLLSLNFSAGFACKPAVCGDKKDLWSVNIQKQLFPKVMNSVIFTHYLPENGYVSHILLTGETFRSIAKEYYNNPTYWTTVWNENPEIADPDRINAGMVLRILIRKPVKPEVLAGILQRRLTAFEQERKQREQEQSLALRAFYFQALRQYPQSSFDAVYKAAGSRFGVPWQILYGIHMTETGGRNGPVQCGYGNGPQGPMQFMPGTFNAYAIDGRGNGRPDINDAVDAIYTAANFLAKHGPLMAGLEAYGGNITGVMELARARGFTQ
jgi:hypothetical protein